MENWIHILTGGNLSKSLFFSIKMFMAPHADLITVKALEAFHPDEILEF